MYAIRATFQVKRIRGLLCLQRLANNLFLLAMCSAESVSWYSLHQSVASILRIGSETLKTNLENQSSKIVSKVQTID